MKKYISIVAIFLMTMSFTSAQARQEDPGMPGGDPDVPLDGGTAMLLIAGAVYGVKKIREYQRAAD